MSEGTAAVRGRTAPAVVRVRQGQFLTEAR